MSDKTKASAAKASTSAVKIPELKEFLTAGVQFGHQSQKWEPKMKKYIFTKRGKIHIIDLAKSIPMLENAVKFLEEAAATGDVLFVGTKRQASEIVREAAINAGAFYITHRWPGGLTTNFELIKQSLKRFNQLEVEFKAGVEDRTKFEVTQMKKTWEKMNRLYEGVKTMKKLPKVIVIVDTKFERGAVKEAKVMGIPTVALVDTNSDPTVVDYPIPANDDAIKSIKLVMNVLSEAVLAGNKGKGVKHDYTDFVNYDVKLVKSETTEEEAEAVAVVKGDATPQVVIEPVKKVKAKAKAKAKVKAVETKTKSKAKEKSKGKTSVGMLESIQQEAETKRIEKAKTQREK